MLIDKTSDGKFGIYFDKYEQKMIIVRIYKEKNMNVKKVDNKLWNLCLLKFKDLDKTVEYLLKKGNRAGHLGDRSYLKN